MGKTIDQYAACKNPMGKSMQIALEKPSTGKNQHGKPAPREKPLKRSDEVERCMENP
jgi:hypothetical protein